MANKTQPTLWSTQWWGPAAGITQTPQIREQFVLEAVRPLPSMLSSSNPLCPAKPHLLKVLYLPQTAPFSEDQVFKHEAMENILHSSQTGNQLAAQTRRKLLSETTVL